MNKKLFFFLLLFFSLILFYNNVSANNSRTMYVDDFSNILGDALAENALLSYAESHEIETLLLYDLHIVHNTYDITNLATNSILADFIAKAKTSYGIVSVGAIAESGAYFTNVIDPYNNSRNSATEIFDIYNLEFEYWNAAPIESGGYYCINYLVPNGLPCTNNGGFQFFLSALQTMDSLANASPHTIVTEAYVGWPTTSQADSIGKNLDRLRLHAYVGNPNDAFPYANNRLIDFANGTPNLPISLIFSAEPTFMQNWLKDNSMLAAENIFMTDFLNTSTNWVNTIDFEGFTYFAYTNAIDVPLQVCPAYNLVQNLSINADTTIYADSLIELDNVVVNPPYELVLIAPEVCIPMNCTVVEGAKLIVIEGFCSE